MATQEAVKKLEKVLALIDGAASKEEFVRSFAAVVKYVKDVDKRLSGDFEILASTIRGIGKKIEDDSSLTIADVKIQIRLAVASLETRVNSKIAEIKDGENGEDGKDADQTAIVEEVLKRLPSFLEIPTAQDVLNEVPKLGERVRDSLELLDGDERLDKKAIRGIEEIEKKINEISIRPTRVGGAKGIGLYVDGTKKLLTAQQINLIAGTNVTLTYSFANGRNDITISSTVGAGAFTVLTATGAVDDSNTSFTFASAPSLVIVNGASYRDGRGCAISGTSVTLDNPVGSGGDIYALG